MNTATASFLCLWVGLTAAQVCRSDRQAVSSQIAARQATTKAIKYVNTKYGFTFWLPGTWKGYSVVEGTWEGGDNDGPQGYEVLERGPIFTIVNPHSTSKIQYQDIDIMVFSHLQWSALQRGKFFIGAAPIGPGELGRNRRYVFAVPPRMINDSLYGTDEVMKIMQGNPLSAF